VKTSNITLNTAYQDLVAVMKECKDSSCTTFTSTAPACSVDSFSVRPQSVTATTATINAAASGSPAVAAGNPFTITATVPGVGTQPSGYNGTLRIDTSGMTAGIDTATEGAAAWTPNLGVLVATPATAYSNTFPAATPDSPSAGQATSAGQFTYSEVGSFSLPAYSIYDGVMTSTDCPGAGNDANCDARRIATTWTAVDSVSTKGDCNDNSFSNTIDSTGRYGCNFGYGAAISSIGRFTPHHYLVGNPVITPRSDVSSCSSLTPFTYMSEPFGIAFSLEAVNASNGVTKNYQGNYVKFNSMGTLAPWTAASNNSTGTMGLAMSASNYIPPGGSVGCSVFFSSAGVTSYSCPSGTTPASTTNVSIGFPSSPSRVVMAQSPSSVPSMLWGSTATSLSTPQGNPGVGLFTANVELLRTSTGTSTNPIPTPDGPFYTLSVGIDPIDMDGNATIGTYSGTNASVGLNLVTNNGPLAPAPDRVSLGTTAEKFGMLKIQNAYGSSLVPLPVSLQMQYWNGTMFLTNAQTSTNTTYDSCTTISGSSVGLTFQGMSACSTYLPVTTTINNGTAIMMLSAPKQVGTVTMTDLVNSTNGSACVGSNTGGPATGINAPYLQGNWSNPANYGANPTGKASFGVFSGSPAVIYTRESY
jgi:MSHA biogenesis protein MshQ